MLAALLLLTQLVISLLRLKSLSKFGPAGNRYAVNFKYHRKNQALFSTVVSDTIEEKQTRRLSSTDLDRSLRSNKFPSPSPSPSNLNLVNNLNSSLSKNEDQEQAIKDNSIRITVVDTVEKANKILKVLEKLPSTIAWACDTEVADIDLDKVGPVGEIRFGLMVLRIQNCYSSLVVLYDCAFFKLIMVVRI